MKKLLSLLLSVILIIGIVPLSAVTVTALTSPDGFYYTVSNGEATVTGHTNPVGELVIPDTLGGYPVVSIDYHAFYGCTGLTSVTIGNSVKSIGKDAFNGCTGLTSVTIGNSVTSIGWYAFEGCTGLTKVNITDLEAWCKIDFGSYNYNANPLSRAKHLYLNGEEITELEIPNTITSINPCAFSGCKGLTSVTIGNSVKSIDWGAFSYCTGLTEITIPEGVTTIGANAFFDCDLLHSITIPSSVTYIGGDAFYCDNLRSVYITDLTAWCNIDYNNQGGSVSSSEEYANPLSCADYLYLNGELIKNLVIPDGVTNIPQYAFSSNAIETVSIPNSVESIGEFAFSGCGRIKSIVIPDGIKTISASTFQDCKALTEIAIPDSVTEIERYAFRCCSSLNEVTFGENTQLKSIDIDAFNDCVALTKFKIPNSVISIGNGAFQDCRSLTKIKIPDGVTTIGNYAFYCCFKLETVEIPANIITINYYAFRSCDKAEFYYYGTAEQWDNIGIHSTNPINENNTYILGSPHEHILKNTEWTFDDNNHYNVCYCGEVISKIHTGGTATCINKAVCTVCSQEYGEVDSLNNTHTEIRDTLAEDCGNDGYTGDTWCTDCNKKISTGSVINATGRHTGGTATCINKAVCTVCSQEYGEVDSLNHTHTEIRDTLAEDCGNDGYTGDTWCTDCNKKITNGEVLPATENHTGGTATCTKKAKCSVCGVEYIGLKAHTYNNACDKSCNVCGANRTVGAHKYTNSCDIDCNICEALRRVNHTYTNACDTNCDICENTHLISHNYTTKVVKKATLTANGSTQKYCTVCKKIVSTSAVRKVSSFKLSTTTYTYNGKAKTPTVTVKNSAGTKLVKNTDYTVTYKNNKYVGKATVTVTFKGKYSGTKKLTFTINPVKTTVSKITKPANKQLKVYITKKSTQVTGYQIQYAANKSFKSAKTKTISSYKTTSATLTKLSAKKTYYVRVRTYKTVNGKKYYSDWSTYKYKKTK